MTRPDYLDPHRSEDERIRLWARAISKAATGLSGGGSEMFVRIGDDYYADPVAIQDRIQSKFDMRDREIRRRQSSDAPPRPDPLSRQPVE